MSPGAGGVDAPCFIGAIVIVVSFVLVIFLLVFFVRQESPDLKDMAERLGGKFVVGQGVLSRNSIEFKLGADLATVDFAPSVEEQAGQTAVVVYLESSPGTLHILRDGFGQSFLRMFGAQDISIGDREFDAAYVVKANPESLAARLFRPEQRARAIAAVRRLSPFENPTIEVTRQLLRIRVREEVKRDAGVLALLKTAEEFMSFLRQEVPSSGVELGEVKAMRRPVCLVCGTGMDDVVVRCELCKTPHHAECWTYVGQCSTYACNGKRWGA
jgi:hypothetical protein